MRCIVWDPHVCAPATREVGCLWVAEPVPASFINGGRLSGHIVELRDLPKINGCAFSKFSRQYPVSFKAMHVDAHLSCMGRAKEVSRAEGAGVHHHSSIEKEQGSCMKHSDMLVVWILSCFACFQNALLCGKKFAN